MQLTRSGSHTCLCALESSASAVSESSSVSASCTLGTGMDPAVPARPTASALVAAVAVSGPVCECGPRDLSLEIRLLSDNVRSSFESTDRLEPFEG